MSCGMAAVPTLTSVGRELLILSRVLTQTFWLRNPNLLLQPPRSSAHSQSRASCFLSIPKPPSDLICSAPIRHMYVFLRHYMIARIHAGRGCFRSALGCYDNGGQTRTAVFAQLRLGYFDSLEVPCELPLSEAKWCICPACVRSNRSQLFH